MGKASDHLHARVVPFPSSREVKKSTEFKKGTAQNPICLDDDDSDAGPKQVRQLRSYAGDTSPNRLNLNRAWTPVENRETYRRSFYEAPISSIRNNDGSHVNDTGNYGAYLHSQRIRNGWTPEDPDLDRLHISSATQDASDASSTYESDDDKPKTPHKRHRRQKGAPQKRMKASDYEKYLDENETRPRSKAMEHLLARFPKDHEWVDLKSPAARGSKK